MNRKEYYNNKSILFEIVKLSKDRELSMLSEGLKIRCIRAHNLYSLEFNFERFDFLDLKSNLYYSLAKLRDMPIFNFDMDTRKEEMKKFVDKFDGYVYEVDLGIDLDSHKVSYEKCYDDTRRLKELFAKYNIPYSLRFSGSGFHINIDGKDMPSKSEEGVELKMEFYKHIVCEISTLLNLPSLDKSIYSLRRIWKLPYTLDYKSGLVCLPLSDSEFNVFNKDYTKPENVVKLDIRDRGLLTRHGNVEGMKKLIGDLID